MKSIKFLNFRIKSLHFYIFFHKNCIFIINCNDIYKFFNKYFTNFNKLYCYSKVLIEEIKIFNKFFTPISTIFKTL